MKKIKYLTLRIRFAIASFVMKPMVDDLLKQRQALLTGLKWVEEEQTMLEERINMVAAKEKKVNEAEAIIFRAWFSEQHKGDYV